MDIGIVTFHAALNCGSMLQAYALQEVLREKYKQNVEIIDFSSKGQRQMYSVIDTKLRPRVFKRNMRILPYWREFEKVRRDYQEFSGKYFITTPKQYKYNRELFELQTRYDILIAGGDQVWNVRCRDTDLAYFLNFSDSSKKVAYSPSLGAVDINTEAKHPEVYKNYLSKFQYLSVREPNGKKWLESLLNRKVRIVADPTLLLTPDQWIKKVELGAFSDKCIFYYAFNYGNKEFNKKIQQIASKLGLKVYVIDRKEWNICNLQEFGFELYPVCNPISFLTLVNAAEYIITDSFHGTVFSALFNKKFCNVKHDMKQDVDDDRSIGLLTQLGLQTRYVHVDSLTENVLTSEIDYDTVNRRIHLMREDGFRYIEEFLGEDDVII